MQEDFEWKQEYDSELEQIALTDVCNAEWTHLRDLIHYKIVYNIHQYLSEDLELQEHLTIKTPEPLPQSSPMSLPSSSPLYNPSPGPSSVHQGLVIPPFPKRERRKDAPMRAHHSTMDKKEADQFKAQIFEQLNEFDNPPFTIQRICELCLKPKKHYKTVGKYLRAVERTILVTSTRDAFPLDVGGEDADMASTYGNIEAMRIASTPLMSPIPFLHDDARRSRSPSPFELAATKRPVSRLGGLNPLPVEPPSVRQPLGLVDELDDPKPGHLADHPTALTSVTSTRSLPVAPLNERFVKSLSPEAEEASRDLPETAESGQAEDAEVEDMVLDHSTIEDEDKENRPS